jgi:hypothetical protein
MLAGSKTGAIIQRMGNTVPQGTEDNRVRDALAERPNKYRIAVYDTLS